jgi:hypothetical protein
VRPFLVFALVLLTLFSSACAEPEPVLDFALRISAPGPLEPLDPQLKSSFTMVVKGLVFDLLVELDAEGRDHSRVLRRWAPTGAGEYRLELIRPLRFSDGSEVRDEDLVASLQAFGLTGRLEQGAVVASAAPGRAPVEALLRSAVLFRRSGEAAVGTGPFRLEEQSSSRIVLRRVKPVPGRIASVELMGFTSPQEAFAGALRGDANALIMPAASQLELLADIQRFQVLRSDSVHALAVIFNAARLSPSERREIAAALSIRDLVRAYGPGCQPYPAAGALGRVSPGKRRLQILALNMANAHRVALAVSRALEPRSGDIDRVATPEDPRLQRGEFDLFVNLVQVSPFSLAATSWRTGNKINFGRYSNPDLDAALQAGDLEAARRALEADPPALNVCRYQLSAAIDSRVRNARLGPYGLLQSLADWEVGP